MSQTTADNERLLAYVRDSGQVVPAPEVTVAVVGHGGHGKSTFVQHALRTDLPVLYAGACACVCLRRSVSDRVRRVQT